MIDGIQKDPPWEESHATNCFEATEIWCQNAKKPCNAPEIWCLKILYVKKPSNELQKEQNLDKKLYQKNLPKHFWPTFFFKWNTLFQINIVVQNTAK